jgi:hypothetical protein
MAFNRKVFFALTVLAMGFSGGFLAQLWFAPTQVEAANNRVFQGSGVYVYGPDSNPRMAMGTYAASGEKGLPFMGLSDNKGDLRLLFRLFGPNEVPVLIFKDSHHRDRMVIGLGLNDSGEEPFIATFDKSGKKHLLMGKYLEHQH